MIRGSGGGGGWFVLPEQILVILHLGGKRSRDLFITLFAVCASKEVRMTLHPDYFRETLREKHSNGLKLPRALGSSGGVVVKLLACRTRDLDSIPGLTATISEIGYLLLPSRDMAEILLKAT